MSTNNNIQPAQREQILVHLVAVTGVSRER